MIRINRLSSLIRLGNVRWFLVRGDERGVRDEYQRCQDVYYRARRARVAQIRCHRRRVWYANRIRLALPLGWILNLPAVVGLARLRRLRESINEADHAMEEIRLQSIFIATIIMGDIIALQGTDCINNFAIFHLEAECVTMTRGPPIDDSTQRCRTEPRYRNSALSPPPIPFFSPSGPSPTCTIAFILRLVHPLKGRQNLRKSLISKLNVTRGQNLPIPSWFLL